MSNGDGKGEGSVFATGGRVAPARAIAEKQKMLANTRAFLDGVAEGDEGSRQYLEALKATLESDLRRLDMQRLEREQRDEEKL